MRAAASLEAKGCLSSTHILLERIWVRRNQVSQLVSLTAPSLLYKNIIPSEILNSAHHGHIRLHLPCCHVGVVNNDRRAPAL